MATKLSVAGWRQSGLFQRAANVACALEHLYPRAIQAEVLELEDKTSFENWLKGRKNDASRHLYNKSGNVSESYLSHQTAPLCYIGDKEYLGGAEDVMELARKRFLGNGKSSAAMGLSSSSNLGWKKDDAAKGEYDYDLLVIGGGSGGLACSKQAASHGKKVAMLDFVKPSPQGTKWGLGGTCVNVGCIPKKLMHQAALLGEAQHDAANFGWTTGDSQHDWKKMVSNVQNHIKSLNFGYRVEMRNKSVKYINALGKFLSPHRVQCTDKKGKVSEITARRIVVAVGGRPTPLPCPGGDLAISSDDMFSLKESPGKTLVVGASYVALECAGFLAGLKYDVTVMVRSILLRGFDQDMATKIGDFMEAHGTKFIRGTVPDKLEKTADGRIKVTFNGGASSDVYDTVLAAIGRRADVAKLGLDAAGVETIKNGKIDCVNEQTNVSHIYAIGDIVAGKPELTPVAIKAGKMLADRLFGGSSKAMDYEKIPTTVFTPLEYGCCGLSEEDAIARFGDSLEVYHTQYTPLEWKVPDHREDNVCYCKVLVDMSDSKRVVGFHILGPNAGEVTQGFGVGMKLGMTFDDLSDTVGIHPTVAEELTTLHVTKSSGASAEKTGC